ncbi:protein-disulfide reductase DsbD domain-containing protein [Polymorphum gilvum]|uniref:Thiol:disulfide interchange protein DsbD N-terminal domain-containing protein n=1 Tax=Polymorphum gilvum (strain LMG 25793 / CGMCC 1.9160 / SL003B-26A1) TaxID=991905 RepID=F2IZ89_POLGS|nr:protein-disulfide reductase DsbD domain-containing protein [Polymorphum gilvum]ADZ71812.1 hypothetical protein SL003B_3390 [Polymorphum gilvum SL003B-26A1]
MIRLQRLFAVLVLLAVPTGGAGAGVSDWVTVQGGAVRLVSAGRIADGTYLAGLEFALDPGWHTYWRFPGEAGIPPEIDLSGSANMAASRIHYPAPERFFDGFSSSIVYHDGVVLPIEVEAGDAAAPVDLTAAVFFGLCNDICIPAEARLALTLDPNGRTDTVSLKAIRAAQAAVPAPAAADGPRVVSVDVVPGKRAPKLIIAAELAEASDQTIDLFAEGPPGSSIALPDLVSRDGGRAVWSLSTRGLRHDGTGADLRLVLVVGDRASESVHRVNAASLK